MTAQPKFIVVEGLEGAGKSTAIAHIKSWLAARGITPVCTREPGGTPLAEKLRDLVKQVRDNEQVAAETELLLMYAARMQLITNVIKPALAAGHWVLADRHDMSSRAYQGGGRGLSDDMINPLRAMVLGNLQPDLTLYLDIDPALGLQRARMRGELDRIEQEQLAFFQRTRDKYRQIASREANIAVIDANLPLAQVQQQISAALDQALA
ncbi:dTMP kinase [Rheinheimera muenzenbergensis]|uniref:Thymidylate kinase n=1 Tax=Rheinheimera muenzenbergensis TaxID=1193628 RepID=A0ABU8C9X1_9GAMM